MQSVAYSPLIPPVAKSPDEMTPGEAKATFAWFTEQIPARLAELDRVLRATTQGSLSLDLSADAVPRVGAWLAEHARWRDMTAEELEGERCCVEGSRISYEDIALFGGTEIVDSATLSLCFDVGIFLAETLRRRHPALRWELVTRPKSDASYHRPVLAPFRDTSRMDPAAIVDVVLYRIHDGADGGAELQRVFEVWDELAV